MRAPGNEGYLDSGRGQKTAKITANRSGSNNRKFHFYPNQPLIVIN